MPYVTHPTFDNDVREVPDDKVDEWVSLGWKKVAKKDEAQAEAQVTTPANS